MQKYKSENGYYKYYNKEGKKCRIKFVDTDVDFGIMVKFKRPGDTSWLYHYPDKIFDNVFSVINYICKNLETDGTVFKIVSSALHHPKKKKF